MAQVELDRPRFRIDGGKVFRLVRGIRSSGRGAPDPKHQCPTPDAWEVYDINALLALDGFGMITILSSVLSAVDDGTIVIEHTRPL